MAYRQYVEEPALTSQNSSFTNVSHSNSLRRANDGSALIWIWNYRDLSAASANFFNFSIMTSNFAGLSD